MRPTSALVFAVLVSGVALAADAPAPRDVGPDPQLEPPSASIIPTVHVPKTIGWSAGETPTPAAGLAVNAFALGLAHPRWLYVLPNGDVLVAETGGRSGANRITLLRDAGRGEATKHVFLEGLHSPFGMALVGRDLYVAETGALLRFPYEAGATRITAKATKVTDLPSGGGHWTRNVVASRDGRELFVSVGSASNVGEDGMKAEEGRAAIWEVDAASGHKRIFASGMRNAVGLGWEPRTGRLWAVVNERDALGDNLVPDYLTSVTEGAFYGWPYSYYGAHVDERVKPQRPDLVAKAVKPDYALGSHVAPLGLAFATEPALAPAFAEGAFIGEHGSWNRSVLAGYKVVFVPFRDGRPQGLPRDVLTGFVTADDKAHGRPVGVAAGRHGELYVADDNGNAVWRVTAAR